MIFLGKSVMYPCAVFPHAFFKIARYACVQDCVAYGGHDINKIVFLHGVPERVVYVLQLTPPSLRGLSSRSAPGHCNRPPGIPSGGKHSWAPGCKTSNEYPPTLRGKRNRMKTIGRCTFLASVVVTLVVT